VVSTSRSTAPGTGRHEIYPYAIQVMEEIGIDISDQYPKGLRTYMGNLKPQS
jgi:protein-tyrosine-phosphatase